MAARRLAPDSRARSESGGQTGEGKASTEVMARGLMVSEAKADTASAHFAE
jgi:hypothetical protein